MDSDCLEQPNKIAFMVVDNEVRFGRNGNCFSGATGNFDVSINSGPLRVIGVKETAFKMPYRPENGIFQSFLAYQSYLLAVSSLRSAL
jgi:hypothetical protein